MNKTNTLTWLHLSDIHFKQNTEWQGEPTREKLLAFLQKQFEKNPQLKPDLIFCTGDIAFGETSDGAMAQQYKLAKSFFDDLLRLYDLKPERLLVVPGNHDINRNQIDPMSQDSFTRWAGDNECRGQQQNINSMFDGYNISIQNAMNRLVPYSQFIADYLPHQVDDNGRCVYQQKLEINNINLGVFGFNSAWSCAGSEDDRRLWLAAQWQFNQLQQKLSGSQIKLGLIHHPVDWFNVAEREVITSRSESELDFLLHGHTHNARMINANQLITVGAGATGAEHDDEFGINITHIDLNQGKGASHLFTFSTKHHDWMKHINPKFAEDGIWYFDLKPELKVALPPELTELKPTKSKSIQTNRHKLYGRDQLLAKTSKALPQKRCALIYGMRGNGKSAFIEALLKQPPLQGLMLTRNTISGTSSAQSIYQMLASQLGDKSETVTMPTGGINGIKQRLSELKPQGSNDEIVIWLENAHLLFNGDEFDDEDIQHLIVAIRAVHPNWYWLFELRERPELGTVPKSDIVEITGLTRQDLGQLFKDNDPTDDNSWHYNANNLKTIYGWLGGGHGKHAHPQATQLLVAVATGLNKTPYDVLKSHIDDFEKQLEDVLLGDLYHQVLNSKEQALFATMGLYRDYVPTDHVEGLEGKLELPQAFDGLNLRCLITSDGEESKYYLHGFFKAWLRQLQGYELDEQEYLLIPNEIDSQSIPLEQIQRHNAIFELWYHEVKGKNRINQQNIRRTNEALFHAIHAGEYHQAADLACEMLGGDSELIYNRLYGLYQHLFKVKASLLDQRNLLTLLIKLKPQQAILYRFLGSCWRQEQGWAHPEVLGNFKKACEYDSQRPENWTNYGKACLSQRDHQLVQRFLMELGNYEQASSGVGINDFVRAVSADCYEFIGEEETAFTIRDQLIVHKTNDPIPYVDQAKALMAQQKYQLAIDVINKAKQNKAYNDHTTSIEAKALQAMGETFAAERLLATKVQSNVRDPAIYNDLAQLYLAQDLPQKALEAIEQAKANRAADQHTTSIEAKALQAMGQTLAAERLLVATVQSNVKNPVFYNDLAQLYSAQDLPQKALEVIELAKANRATDKYTVTIEEKIRKTINSSPP